MHDSQLWAVDGALFHYTLMEEWTTIQELSDFARPSTPYVIPTMYLYSSQRWFTLTYGYPTGEKGRLTTPYVSIT